ncbi:MAG TPA: hypothetical protein VMQ61_10190 [Thermoanaerobaculia bacterium]|nr:hypothetical protein [Thermoanaerobaculia bacterium]
MKFLQRTFLAGLACLLAGGVFLFADDSWRSPLTLGEKTQIPGGELEPGKYMVRVLDTKTTRMVVQFMSEDENKVFATVMAVPDYRVTVAPEGQFIFFQRAEGMPQALKGWFYPVNNFGIEFVYPKVEAMPLAQARHEEVLAAETAKPEAKEPVIAVTPEMKEIPWKAPETTVAQLPPQDLPRTASDLPLIAVTGLAMIAAGLALRVLVRR